MSLEAFTKRWISTHAGLAYGNANKRTCLTLPNGVIASYGYNSASRVTSITYGTGESNSVGTGGSSANPPSNMGNLIYTYDGNGRRTAVGGTLAAVNLPASVSGNTFDADIGMTPFNGQTLGYDATGNLTPGLKCFCPSIRDPQIHDRAALP